MARRQATRTRSSSPRGQAFLDGPFRSSRRPLRRRTQTARRRVICCRLSKVGSAPSSRLTPDRSPPWRLPCHPSKDLRLPDRLRLSVLVCPRFRKPTRCLILPQPLTGATARVRKASCGSPTMAATWSTESTSTKRKERRFTPSSSKIEPETRRPSPARSTCTTLHSWPSACRLPSRPAPRRLTLAWRCLPTWAAPNRLPTIRQRSTGVTARFHRPARSRLPRPTTS